jgi:hypothetical protein
MDRTDSLNRYLKSIGVQLDADKFLKIAETAAEEKIDPGAIVSLLRGHSRQEVTSLGLAQIGSLQAWLRKLSDQYPYGPCQHTKSLITGSKPLTFADRFESFRTRLAESARNNAGTSAVAGSSGDCRWRGMQE